MFLLTWRMTSQNIPKDAHLQSDSEEPDSEWEVLEKISSPPIFVLFTLSILYMHNCNGQ